MVGKSKYFIQIHLFLIHKQCLAKITMIHTILAHQVKQSIQSVYKLNNKPEMEVLRKVGWLLEKEGFTCPYMGHDAYCA